MGKPTAYKLAERYRDASKDEVAALKELANGLPPNPIVVNIGAGNRAISTLAILEERPDAWICSIDVKAKENEFIYLKRAGLPWERVVRFLGKSQDVGKHWPWKVDMIYVDGDHSYIGVVEDTRTWFPKVKRGGVMAYHDYIDLKGQKTQAGRAIDEMMAGKDKILWIDRIIAFRGA